MGRALGTEISGRSPHKKAIVPLHLELLHLISREEDDLASVSLWPSGRHERRFFVRSVLQAVPERAAVIWFG